MTPAPSSSVPSSGGTLVALDGRALPLRRADLRVRARGGLARTVLEQRFVNPHAEPLRVTYSLPLPADGAVSGFRFCIDDEVIVGEVDLRRRARERFEQALVEGHTAALVEQERSSLFSQEVGNIPPGATVVVMIEVDQPLRWLTDAGEGSGGWEYRFPTVVAPRYLGAPGRVADGSRVAVPVATSRRPIEMSLSLRIDEAMARGGVPGSPSHALSLTREAEACTVGLAQAGVGLDRDVVVRWPVAAPKVGLHLDLARPREEREISLHAFGLVTLVPPRLRPTAVPRDLIVLLDTSGSMHGEPLAQAQRVTCALIDGLRDSDRLELLEFSTAVRRFARKPLPATRRNRAKASRWVRKLSAGGGTEMRTGIIAALEGLRPEAQRQIVLITDGHIGFEHEVLSQISERLPRGSRIHTVGVGSAVNRSLTEAAARVGRGLEVVVGLGEDAEPAIARLLARTEAPLVVDLELSGEALLEHTPRHLPDLFAESPALVATRLRPEGGTLRVRGRTADGPWEAELSVPARAPGEGSPAVTALFGRERVEDLELQRAAGAPRAPVDRQIEQVGVGFQIATRLTSWVAISQEARVDPGEPTRRETVPQQLPHGMSVEGLGLRASGGGPAPAPAAIPMQAEPRAYGGVASLSAPWSQTLGRVSAAPPVQGRDEPTGAAPMAPPPPPSGGAPSPAPGAPPPPSAPGRSAAPPPPRSAPVPRAPAAAPPPAKTEVSPSFDDAEQQEEFRRPMEAPPADVDMRDMDVDDEMAFDEEPDMVEVIYDPASADEFVLDQPTAHGRAKGGTVAASGWGTAPGRIVLHRDGRLIVEVTLPFFLDWRPPSSVELVLADGLRLTASLRPTGTTHPAQLQPGMLMRLVVELSADTPAPLSLELRVDGRRLIIDPLG